MLCYTENNFCSVIGQILKLFKNQTSDEYFCENQGSKPEQFATN